jgi:hypothetical protein
MSQTQQTTAKARAERASKRPAPPTSLPAGPDYWPVPAQRSPRRRPVATEDRARRSDRGAEPAS